jgi:hypothetical protein
MYTIDTDFEEIYYSKGEQVGGVDMQNSWDTVREDVSDEFTTYQNIPSYQTSGYLAPNGLVVSVSVDHQMGDHFEMLLKYDDINQFYKLNQNYCED